MYSLESVPLELASGIPLPPLKQDSDPPFTSLKEEPQEMVGDGYIKLEHESSDQGVFCGISSSCNSKF